MSRRSLVLASVTLVPLAWAGQLEDLPDNTKAFQERLDAIVKPGDNSRDTVALLQRFRFECESLSATEIWCHRLDESALNPIAHRYQVVLTTREGHVVTAKASTGLVGP
jgi:hypothetical protein